MTILRNVNPIGHADLPLIGRQGDPIGEHGSGCLEPGEEFECSPEHARLLLAQTGNYEPVDADARSIFEELQAEADPVEPDRPDDPPPGEVPVRIEPNSEAQ